MRVELGILVGDRSGIVEADGLEGAAREGTQIDGVHPALVLWAAVTGAAHPHRALQRRAQGFLERGL